MLSMGIIGLPNVGKSTLFNALSAGRAEVSNYPFTTIEANVGVVEVPDPRLLELADLLQPQKITPCAIRFIDIAGLVKGASKGEGLGNQFLGEIRAVDAIAHVIRCFSDSDIAHVFAGVDPARDAEVVETELILADLELLGRTLAKLEKEWRTHPQEHARQHDHLLAYRETLERGEPLRSIGLDREREEELKALGVLTSKPLLWVANITEGESECPDALERVRLTVPGSEVLSLSAKIEWEISQLEPEERQEFLVELGLEESGLDRLVRASFDLLGLVTFYTVVKNKLQAWAVPRATHAPEAAGKVHSDMERGFIRAHVVSTPELLAHGSLHELQHAGLMRTVGKDYEVQDGDVVEFLFHV